MISCYYKPKKNIAFLDTFKNDFKLNLLKEKNKTSYLENQDMLVSCKPDIVSVLIYRDDNKALVKKLNSYFFS